MQRNLTIDVGNTSVKAAIYEDGRLVESGRKGMEGAFALVDKHHPGQCAYSIVGEEPPMLSDLLRQIPGRILHVDGCTPAPIRNAYHQPETLGADRWAAAVGAWTLYGPRNLLVVDSGTCITYDFVDGEGTFQGGIIAPGVRMRLDAMHQMTHLLPAVEAGECHTFPSPHRRMTTQAMEVGARLGAAMELKGYIRYYTEEYDNLLVCLTGGERIDYYDKNYTNFCYVPDLVFQGLNALLNYEPSETAKSEGAQES